MDLDLTGKRALVCGSTQGIGRAAAVELARLGCGVTLLARSVDSLERVRAELPAERGQKHDWVAADFADAGQVKAAAVEAVSRHGTVHILVNNTGWPPGGRAIDADPSAYLAAFTAHIIAAQILAQAVVPGMSTAGYGRIVNIISTSVKAPIPGLGVSNTIRGAMASWSKTLATELAASGITVNNVLPGFTETERLTSLIQTKARNSTRPERDVREEMRLSVPAQRFASAGEVGAAVAFLASPAAGYINGINLPVDGGRTPSL